MDMKSKSCLRLRKLHSQAMEGCTPPLHTSQAWRRSGDESYWESLRAEVHRAPRAARPQSCIEGWHGKDWLPGLEQLQTCPTQPQFPAFAERTASMPALLSATGNKPLHHLDYSNSHYREGIPSYSPSLGGSSVCSLESLESQSGLETRERAQIKPVPSMQKVKLCSLTPIQLGWLPLRRRVVLTDSPNHPRDHDSSTIQVKPQRKPQPLVTSLLTRSSIEADGSGPGARLLGLPRLSQADGEAEWSGAEIASGSWSPGTIRDHSSPQTAVKEIHTPSDRDVQDTTHDWTTRLRNAVCESSTPPPTCIQGKNISHRQGSAPQPSPLIAPSTGGSPTPRHSRSLSSITITSRMVSRSSSLPNTSLPPQAEGRSSSLMGINTNPAKHPNTQHSKQVDAQRKAMVIKVTEHRAQTSTIVQFNDKDNTSNISHRLPSNQNTSVFSTLSTSGSFVATTSMKNHTSPVSLNITSRDNYTPDISDVSREESPSVEASNLPFRESVVLRKKPTIIKVVEQSEQLIGESKEAVTRPQHRHSYTAGLCPSNVESYTRHSYTGGLCPSNTRSYTRHGYTGGLCPSNTGSYTSNPSFTSAKPPISNESSAPRFEVGSVQPGWSKKEVVELHRSTLSIQLNSASTHPTSMETPCRWVGVSRRRPASWYAGLFSPSESSGEVETQPGFQRRSLTLPHETNTDPASLITSSSNRCWSTGGEAGRIGEVYPRRESTAWDEEQREQRSALLQNQPFSLIKVPDNPSHGTRHTILALNAAAVIANVKAQSQQRKRTKTQTSSAPAPHSTDTGSSSTAKSNTNTGTSNRAESNTNTETSNTAESNTNTETSNTAESNTNTETSNTAESNTNTETSNRAESNTNTETSNTAESNTNTETSNRAESNTNTGTSNRAESNTDTGTSNRAESNTNTETSNTAENNTNTGTSNRAESNTNTETSNRAESKPATHNTNTGTSNTAESKPAAHNTNTESRGVMQDGEGSAGASCPVMSDGGGCEEQTEESITPLENTDGTSSNLHTLSDALEQKQFIQHSQVQVQRLLTTDTPASVQRDNTLQSCDRNISEKTHQQFRLNYSNLLEMKRRQEERREEEEEMKQCHRPKLVSQTSKLRAESFSKTVVEEVLHEA